MLGTTGCVCGSKLGTTIRLVCEGNRLSDIKFIKQRHPSGAFVDLHREMRCLFGSDLLGRLANQFLFDASGFTRTAAQIVKFSTAYIATAFYFNAGNLRGIPLESTFDCFARRNLAADKERVQQSEKRRVGK